ncbi:MAG: S49 family peptidase [Pirellulaceae bacterium]
MHRNQPYLSISIGLALAVNMLLAGCASRPLQTIMRGAMRMTGDLSMDGDMRMAGDMNMSGEVTTIMRTDNSASPLSSVPVYEGNTATGSVAVIDVDGLLVNKNISGLGSMGENPVALFREKLDAIAKESSVKAIVLRINSPGGGVTAADVMTRDLLQVAQQRDIPVVACLMDVGAGGAYYLATAADHIVAHPTSLVGGIGVILNVYFMEDMSTFSVASKPVVAGDKINMATPDRQMAPEERKILQGIADEFHQRFIARVQFERGMNAGLPADLIDGRVIPGTMAVSSGLADATGYLDDAVVKARELAGLGTDSPVVMLRRDNDRAYTLLDITPNTPTMSSIIPLKIPGLDRSQMPNFLYLWQPEPSMISGL